MNPQIVDCSLQIRILERVPLIFDPLNPRECACLVESMIRAEKRRVSVADDAAIRCRMHGASSEMTGYNVYFDYLGKEGY